MKDVTCCVINSFHPTAEAPLRPSVRQKACGHVAPRRVRSVRASYLKIVKADRDRTALARGAVEGERERKQNRAVGGGRLSLSLSLSLPAEQGGAFKVMAFHWRCYKFICHNLLYAALLAYLYMPSSGHTQIPPRRAARVRYVLFRMVELWRSDVDGTGREREGKDDDETARHCRPPNHSDQR